MHLFTGKISILEDATPDSFQTKSREQAAGDISNTKMKLTTLDIYKELRLRGYDYGKTFQGILETNNLGNRDFASISKYILQLRFCYSATTKI